MNPAQNSDPDRSDDTPPSTPHGPHPTTIDEVSGGADSSPDENLSSDERAAKHKAAQEAARRP